MTILSRRTLPGAAATLAPLTVLGSRASGGGSAQGDELPLVTTGLEHSAWSCRCGSRRALLQQRLQS